ncbi:NACHT domain-containing protein, partial [Acidobacteriota bacterium]
MIFDTIISWLPKWFLGILQLESLFKDTIECKTFRMKTCYHYERSKGGSDGEKASLMIIRGNRLKLEINNMEIIISIIGIIVTSISIVWGIIQFRKTKELEKQKREWKISERRLEQEKFEWEKEKANLEQSLKESADALKNWETAETEGRKLENSIIYCHKIAQEFRYIIFAALKNPRLRNLQFEKVYLKQHVGYRQLPGMQTNSHLKETIKEDFQTAFENLYKEDHINLKLIIQGPAGSGKTTLLKWIALHSNPSEDHFFTRFLPIFIPLKDLGQDPAGTYKAHNLNRLTGDRLIKINIEDTLFFEDAFEKGNVIFLFDGLDEVTDEHVRGEILKWIMSQNIRRNPLLITTRASALQETGGFIIPPSIPVFSLTEFDMENINQFLKNWCNNIDIEIAKDERQEQQMPEDTAVLQIKIEEKCSHLKEIIETNKSLQQLAANPLLLTIIAILQSSKEQLQWPMKQHELYEKCLKLMIELKDSDNSQPDVGLPVKNCIEYLSYIAYLLMETNCGEIELSKIKKFLHPHLEEPQLDSFLKDMVQETGLLYESKDKLFGFSHIAFQEYLAARYFAREKSPNDILKHQDKNGWPEIVKLYLDMIDDETTRQFLNVIIPNLVKKDYWKQMTIWENRLLDFADENIRKEIEIRFAQEVLKILRETGNNFQVIISLYPHYPLYLYASQFIDDAWELFNNAKHPFTQSIASTILHSCDKNPQADITEAQSTKAELMNQLKNRIDDFEKQEEKNTQTYTDFILQNSNTFPLIFASRKNILDFNYGLEKLKSGELFFNFLILHTLESIVDTLSAGEVLELLNLADLRKLLEFLEVQKFLEKFKLSVGIDLLTLRDFLKLDGFMKLRIDMGDIRIFIEPKYFNRLRGLVAEYEDRHWSRLKELKKEINTWVDLTTAKLHSLIDQEILDYFPGTT